MILVIILFIAHMINHNYAGCYTDQVFFVHEYDNFYGVDYGTGRILSSTWDELRNNGIYGEIILMCETWYVTTYSGLRRLYWDSVSATVKNEPIYLATGSAKTADLWEHGCFSRGGSSNVLPGGFSFCYYTSLAPSVYVQPFKLSKGILTNYGITGTPSSFSFSSTGLPAAVAGVTKVAIVQDNQNGFYLQIVSGPVASGGFLDLSVQYTGQDDSEMKVRVQNNPTDSYLWNNNREGKFVWRWTTTTSGLVIGPIAAIPAMQHFSFSFRINGIVGISEVQIVTNSTTQYVSATNGTNFLMKRVSCKCGSGIQGGDYCMLKYY